MIAMGAALVLVAGGFWAIAAYQEGEADERRARREERHAERVEEGMEALRDLREESAEIIPDVLGDIALGMTLDEVRRVRGSAMAPDDRPAEEGIRQWHERLPNGGEVMYGFEASVGVLLQVQILSLLPDVTAIAPHLTAMNEMYGVPTGIWDCPRTGDVPTRRFTWRRSETGISDIFLIVGERVSLTLYITTVERTAQSLSRAGCQPIAPDALDSFPVADHVPTDESAPAPETP